MIITTSVAEISPWRSITAKQHAISQKRSGSMLSSRLRKYRYAISAHLEQ